MENFNFENFNGVQKIDHKDGHFVVDIFWSDGEKSQMTFPEKGFEVINKKTGEKLGSMTSDRAIKTLIKHSGSYKREDFSFDKFFV